MICWVGGADASLWPFPALREAQHWMVLHSFFHISKERPLPERPTTTTTTTMITPDQFRFFLDSGAYSAWTKGSVIDIDEYCAFIRANIEHIDVYPCLDVIPGKPGAYNATEKERDEAAEATWRNYLYMVGEGLDPIPVYHYGEGMQHLERMLDYGCQYIGIGGLVAVPNPLRVLWLDRVFKRITNAKGEPLVKTHGFGMTSVNLIFRYPWYSVDSTTWIKQTMSGNVYLPALVGDEFVFDQTPRTVVVSKDAPKRGPDCAASFSPRMRAILDRWLAMCGKTLEEVSEHYYHRAVVNVHYFKRVSEVATVRVFKPDTIRKQSFF